MHFPGFKLPKDRAVVIALVISSKLKRITRFAFFFPPHISFKDNFMITSGLFLPLFLKIIHKKAAPVEEGKNSFRKLNCPAFSFSYWLACSCCYRLWRVFTI